MHGESGLDQPGRAGRRHGVADHRLHRPEAGPLLAGLERTEELADRCELGRVARGRRRAVRLDQADRLRLEPRIAPTPA